MELKGEFREVVENVCRKYGNILLTGVDLNDVITFKAFKAGKVMFPADARRLIKVPIVRNEVIVSEDPLRGVPRVSLSVRADQVKLTAGSIKQFLKIFLEAYSAFWSVVRTDAKIVLYLPDGRAKPVSLLEFFRNIAEHSDVARGFYRILLKLGNVIEKNAGLTIDDVKEFYKYLYAVDEAHNISRIIVRYDDKEYVYDVLDVVFERLRSIFPRPVTSKRGKDFFSVLTEKGRLLELLYGKEIKRENLDDGVAMIITLINVSVGLGIKSRYVEGELVRVSVYTPRFVALRESVCLGGADIPVLAVVDDLVESVGGFVRERVSDLVSIYNRALGEEVRGK